MHKKQGKKSAESEKIILSILLRWSAKSQKGEVLLGILMNETEGAIIGVVKNKYILIEKEKRQSLWKQKQT